MAKPRFTQKSQQEKSAHDLIPYGSYKGKTIGWMADNHPIELEAWAKGKGYRLPISILETHKQSKALWTIVYNIVESNVALTSLMISSKL